MDHAEAGLIAGVDEAGRGPLAGPVVAAAVVLGPHPPPGIADSKRLSGPRRERLFEAIVQQGASVSYAVVSPRKIDDINVLQATLQAMRRAIVTLAHRPDVVHVDGNQPIPDLDIPQRLLIRGDARSLAIGAASIVAKVIRDRMMVSWSSAYPQYGFEKHKGYGTPAHLGALTLHGPCALHRYSFAPVHEHGLFDPAPCSVEHE